MEAAREMSEAQELALRIEESCARILQEVELFEQFTDNDDQKLKGAVDLKGLKSMIIVEQNRIKKLSQADPSHEGHISKLKASNHTFEDTVWCVAKTCIGLLSVDSRRKPEIICSNGREWVKVSAVTEKQIMWEMV
ncbi:hypothetical protein B0O99DRAFT_609273 [Bisporella sp. PMI_857]|nr:hypothetical protein B0O99DRAFT_609273 [Bisporella sp. PMI_857]